MVRETVGHLGCEIDIEPGRLVAGNAGILVTSVSYLKSDEGREFVIVDAAMNDLLRPAMYGAHHDIVPVREPAPGRRGAPSTSSARSANRATPSRATARCRPSRRARCWRSGAPGPTGR